VAAQCFRRTELDGAPGGAGRYDHRFLCLYENTDPEVMTGRRGPKGDPDMLMSSAADHSKGLAGGYYDTVVQRTKTPGQWPDADLLIEWIEPAAATVETIEWYVTRHFLPLLNDREISSGWLGKLSSHQLYDAPRPAFVATYRTTRLEHAVRAWRDVEAAAPRPAAEARTWLMYFRQATERMTRIQVMDPDPTAREAEQATRDAVRARWQAGAS
jgi:hypothetical protein